MVSSWVVEIGTRGAGRQTEERGRGEPRKGEKGDTRKKMDEGCVVHNDA